MTLALFDKKKKEVVKTVVETGGFALPNGDFVSPAYAGWEDDNFILKTIDETVVVPLGKRIASSEVKVIGGKAQKIYVFEDIPPEPTPTRISPRQFAIQLEIDGIYDKAEAWIDSQPRIVRIAYDKSKTVYREDKMLQRAFKELGYPPERVDQFFADAAKLVSDVDV